MPKRLKIGPILLILFIVAISIILCMNMSNMNNNQKDNYVQEGVKSRCTDNYRLYGSEGELEEPLPRDRCRSCVRSTYDPANYEFYCPHNCRELGVSLCDQGKIM